MLLTDFIIDRIAHCDDANLIPGVVTLFFAAT